MHPNERFWYLISHDALEQGLIPHIPDCTCAFLNWLDDIYLTVPCLTMQYIGGRTWGSNEVYKSLNETAYFQQFRDWKAFLLAVYVMKKYDMYWDDGELKWCRK